MTGYDPEAWNWETNEVQRHISNVEELYFQCQGQDANSLRSHCEAYGIPGVDVDNVNWAELAEFFGEA